MKDNTLVVVVDLGCLKAYRLVNNDHGRTPRLQPVEEFRNSEAHERLVDRVSDLAGRFPRGTGGPNGGAMSDGERHNIQLEQRKRLVRGMAQRINALARDKEIEQCFLAASREIVTQLVADLEPRVRAKIARNVSADLTKVERADLMKHF